MSTTAKSGFLLIADITGYTVFLTASELDHARGILEELFAAMLARLKLPFVLSNVQGDAILAHARGELVSDGNTVVHTVEALYFGFAHELERIVNNNTCTCNACRNASKLDLKLLVHFGAYVEQNIGGRTELGGADVILIHRLMKNSVSTATGIIAYAAFTEAAVEAANLPAYFANLRGHTETTADFGQVALRVADLRLAWREQHQREKIIVAEDEAWFSDVSVAVAATPDHVWHYLNDPVRRGEWVADVLRLTRSKTEGGRIVPGTVDHCAHGNGKATVMTILDVQPYDYITYDVAMPFKGAVRTTIFVAPTPTGSLVTVRSARPNTGNAITRALLRAMTARAAPAVRKIWTDSFDRLVKAAKRDALSIPASAAVSDAVRAAVAQRFAS